MTEVVPVKGELARGPQEGKWIAKPARPRLTLHRVLVSYFLLNAIGQILQFIEKGTGAPWIGFVSTLFLLGYLAVLGCAAVQDLWARRVRRSDRALSDGDVGEQFSVEVTIFVYGKPIGLDRGLVWFADGLMGFSGKSTSFLLAAKDFTPWWPTVRLKQRGRKLPVGTLQLHHRGTEAYVTVTPVFGQTKAFRARLAAFKKAGGKPRGGRQWPPVEGFRGE